MHLRLFGFTHFPDRGEERRLGFVFLTVQKTGRFVVLVRKRERDDVARVCPVGIARVLYVLQKGLIFGRTRVPRQEVDLLGVDGGVLVECFLVRRQSLLVLEQDDVAHDACVVHRPVGQVFERLQLRCSVVDDPVQRFVDPTQAPERDHDDHDQHANQGAEAPSEAARYLHVVHGELSVVTAGWD